MENERIRTIFPAVFNCAGRGSKGEVRNVSNGGLFVRTAELPEEGEPLRIRLLPPGKVAVEVSGLVWWKTGDDVTGTGRSGFGLRVLDADEGYERLVASMR